LRSVSLINLVFSLALKRSPMLTPGKVREISHPDWVCDNHDITQETGWKPAVLLEEGLRRTLGLSDGNIAAATDQS
jgi:nucleoside-diphosphate-sugar epimerase